MCGLGAIFSKNKSDLNYISKMMDSVSHRGPDSENKHDGKFKNTYWTLGHKRLAIIDLSSQGSQPMRYKDFSIIFNGEIYNYVELKSELKKNNIKFYTDTDTEVLLKSYLFWGKRCLNKFLGMFSFIILNNKTGEIFVARDRFGVKPLFYFKSKNSLYFASEIKQFFKIKNFKFEPNHNIIKEFLIWDKVNHKADQTFYNNVKSFPPSCYLKMNLKNLNDFKISKYYNLNNKEKTNKTEKQIFIDALKIRLRSDRKIGLSLSGGMDSSLIACSLKKIIKKDILSFSACFKNFENDESKYIDILKKELNIKSYKIFPSLEILKKEINKVLYHQDEPFGSFSIFSQYLIMREAKKKNIKVMLGGQGADEILGGYKKYTFISLIEFLRDFKLIRFFKEFFYLCFNFDKRLFYLPHIEKYFALFFANKLSNKTNDFFLTKYNDLKSKKIRFNLIEFRKNDIFNDSLPALLRFEERNSMANSIETRLPFIDSRFVEKIVNNKEYYPLYKGKLKFKFFDYFRDIIPEKILARRNKIGFEAPDNKWLKKGFNKIIFKNISNCDYLSDKINKNYIKRIYKQVNEGNFNNIQTYIRIGIFSIWYNQIIKIFHEKKK